MLHYRSIGNNRAVLFFFLGSQAPTLTAFVPPTEPVQALSSPRSVVLTARAAFSTFSTTRSLGLIMSDVMIDNHPSSSSSDSGTPTTSSIHASTSTSTGMGIDGIRRIPSSGPIIAGILAGTIVIATIIVVCFVKRRYKRPRRRHYPFDAQISLQPGSHAHRLSRIRDGTSSEDDPPKQNYHRHSRHSRYPSSTVASDVVQPIVVTQGARQSKTDKRSLLSCDRKLHSAGGSTSLAFSPALNTDKIDVNKPNHTVVDRRQTSVSSSTPPSSETVSSNQYPPGPTLGTELSLQLPSQPSQNEHLFQHRNTRNTSALPPETHQQHLNALIQQRAILLASSDTSDKGVYNQLLLLDEQIQILRHQDMSPSHQDEPPPYEGHR